ncbi:MAG: hypothetical protein U1F00_09690 [Rhodoferax sp.]|jgi:hypothetical protein|nr:hypothetical protein [Rhodoferax sp.]
MTRSPLPAAIAGLTLLLCAGASLAQAPAPATAPAGEKQVDRKIERIRVDETGTRIDELRVGGETQTITVSPKGSMPAYEVLPATANRAPSAGERNSASGSGGTRVWKIFGF